MKKKLLTFGMIAAVIMMMVPIVVSAARTDGLWDYIGNYYAPNGSVNGADLFLKGINHYINFNVLTGSSGYGFRDNAGSMEFKNSGGSWTAIGSGGASGVSSFNTRTGAVTLSSSDVTTALTYTPYNATNPSNYITSSGAPVQSVSNSDGTLTISPTTGSVVASIALGHANTWTGNQIFSNGISVTGATSQLHAELDVDNNISVLFLGGGSGCTNTTGLKTGSDGTFLFDAGCSIKFKGGSGLTWGYTDGSFNYVFKSDALGNTTQNGVLTVNGTATSTIAGPLNLTSSTNSLIFSDNSTSTSNGILVVDDEKTSGTAGGSSVAGVQTRTLNNVVSNTISGASLNTGTSVVTLPAGTYRIIATSPNWIGNKTKIYWYDQTSSATTTTGANMYSDAGGTDPGMVTDTLVGRFTITASHTFILKQYVQQARATNGLGVFVGQGTEVYSTVQITKE